MNTAYVIRAEGFANGVPCPHKGEYLETFDHDADDGRGYATFTTSLHEAMQFASVGDAMEFWRKPSTVRRFRRDGQLNRPLTALTVSIETWSWSEERL